MRKTRATLVGAAAAAMVMSGAGLAAASGSAAAASAGRSGIEHFSLMTTVPSARRYTVIAHGVFTAGGVDIAGRTTDTIKFGRGSFKIHHGGKVTVIRQSGNRRTCLGRFEGTAKFTIGGGTGAYRRIRGFGKALISELAIFPRTRGRCNFNRNPLTNQETIRARAHIRL